MKEGWKINTLKELSIISGDYGLSVPSKPFDGVRYLRITDITNSGDLNDDKVSANIENKKQEELQEGDVLFARTGATVGKTLVFRKEFGECLYAGYLIRYRLNKDIILPRYMHYITHSNEYYDWVATNQEAAAQPNISAKKYNLLPVRYPSLEEQQRIVSYLDAAFAQIDVLKANAGKQLDEARKLFQKALEEAMKPKEGWKEKTLKEIGLTQTGTTPSKADANNYGDYIPFIRPSEIDIDDCGSIDYDSEIKLSERGLNVGRLFKKHSILMVCIGATISKVGFCSQDVSCNQQINVLTPKTDYDYKFVYYAMRNKNFKNKVIKEGTSAQATLPIINKGKWERLSIFCPSIEVQQKIVASLDALSANIKKLEEVQRKTVAECDALKQAMLREVFE